MTTSAEPSSPASAQRQRVPDFFIVGHHKCGTTALYAMLGRHPEIYLPLLKEPRFFATDLSYPNPPERKLVPESLEEYLALFDGAAPGQLTGDGSPMYLWSREAAGNIAAVRPEARMIAILREPASFLHSLHNHWLLHHIEPEKDLRTAISLEQARREGRDPSGGSFWPQALLYSDHVRYVEQLRRYEDAFPKEQLLVLVYDDFRRDNEATVRRVLGFLGVDDTLPIELLERMTTTTRVRAQRLDGLLRAMYVGDKRWSRLARTGLRAVSSEGTRRRASRFVRRRVVYGKPQAPDEALVLELRHRFKGEVEALSEHLDRDLVALWGYDKLG
jgi:Sulfotransferase family